MAYSLYDAVVTPASSKASAQLVGIIDKAAAHCRHQQDRRIRPCCRTGCIPDMFCLAR